MAAVTARFTQVKNVKELCCKYIKAFTANSLSSWLFQSVSWVLGNFDDKLHGVFGLVAESPSNGIHCVLMCNTLEGLSVY